MADDLDVLAPAGASVTYRSETLQILPLTIGQLPRLVRAARPVIDAVLDLDGLPELALAAGAAGEGGQVAAEGAALPGGAGDLVGVLLDLIDQHGERVFEAAALCTGKPADWIADGDPAEFVDLVLKVVEVNRDFFLHKLAPRLARASDTWKTRAGGTGPTPSSC